MHRIGIVILILCTCFVPAAWGQKINCPTQFNWSEFHTVDMARWNPCEKVLNVNNVGNLQLLWSYTAGYTVVSSPAVVNGVVFIGSTDGNVYALNAGTGALLWSYTTAYYVVSSPALANGVVYIGSHDGNLYALKASTGTLLWSYRTEGHIDAAPAVANGVVYVGDWNHAFGLK